MDELSKKNTSEQHSRQVIVAISSDHCRANSNLNNALEVGFFFIIM